MVIVVSALTRIAIGNVPGNVDDLVLVVACRLGTDRVALIAAPVRTKRTFLFLFMFLFFVSVLVLVVVLVPVFALVLVVMLLLFWLGYC